MGFLRRNRFSVILILLVLIALGYFSYNAGRPGSEPNAGRYFVEALGPVQGVITSVGDFFESIWRRYFNLVQAAKENEKLALMVDQMRQELAQTDELKQENERLRALLSLEQRHELPVVAAQVVGGDPTGYFRTVLISRGALGGVEPLMPVVNAAGVVGRVIWASPNYAKVLLLTDKNSGVDVLVQRTRARGIITGMDQGMLEMKYILHTADVRAGDKLITSGAAGVYPKGMLVGYVTRAEQKGKGVFLDVQAKPAVDFNRLEDVLVILDRRELPE